LVEISCIKTTGIQSATFPTFYSYPESWLLGFTEKFFSMPSAEHVQSVAWMASALIILFQIALAKGKKPQS